MPANSTGYEFWHPLARETGRLGHLYSPGAQRGPWTWFPYALDNGAYSCWAPGVNCFDDAKWERTEPEWRRLLFWAQAAPIQPLWALVPDVPGNAARTIERWAKYAPEVAACKFQLAVAVQDGMMPLDVQRLSPTPAVIFVGGSTEWKWGTVETWCENFPRVHVGRCNAPERFDWLQERKVESTDGTGMNRGDRKQTRGVEEWCRRHADPKYIDVPLWPYVCRKPKKTERKQLTFV